MCNEGRFGVWSVLREENERGADHLQYQKQDDRGGEWQEGCRGTSSDESEIWGEDVELGTGWGCV